MLVRVAQLSQPRHDHQPGHGAGREAQTGRRLGEDQDRDRAPGAGSSVHCRFREYLSLSLSDSAVSTSLENNSPAQPGQKVKDKISASEVQFSETERSPGPGLFVRFLQFIEVITGWEYGLAVGWLLMSINHLLQYSYFDWKAVPGPLTVDFSSRSECFVVRTARLLSTRLPRLATTTRWPLSSSGAAMSASRTL